MAGWADPATTTRDLGKVDIPRVRGSGTMASEDAVDRPADASAPPDVVAFFAGSWHRFTVLQALRTAPRTRHELRELTGVSRPTLSRILRDLGERDWLIRVDDTYRATPPGTVVAAEVAQFVENIEATASLDGALAWLPTERFEFDLARLADATVLTPDPADQTGPMRRLVEDVEATATLEVVATGVNYEVVEAVTGAALDGDLTLRVLLDDRGLAAVRSHAALTDRFGEVLAGGGDVYRYHGDDELVECNLLDDVVLFCGHTDDGRPAGILRSEDPHVRAWTAAYVERLRGEAEPLGVDAFTA